MWYSREDGKKGIERGGGGDRYRGRGKGRGERGRWSERSGGEGRSKNNNYIRFRAQTVYDVSVQMNDVIDKKPRTGK